MTPTGSSVVAVPPAVPGGMAGQGAVLAPAVRGILLAVAATVAYAVVDTISKHLVRQYPGTMVVWARYAVPALLMLIYLASRQSRSLWRPAYPGVQVLRGLLMTGATLCMVFALRAMPIAEAQAISFVHPLLLTVMAVCFLGERVSPVGWIAVLMGLVGVLIIVRPGGGLFSTAALLPLGMALCFAAYQILTRRIASRANALNSLFYMLLVGALVLSAALPFVWVTPTPAGAILLVVVGMLAGAGHFAMIKALEFAPASLLAPFSYGQLLWVTVLGALVFGDFPDGLTLLGMAVVAAGGFLVAACASAWGGRIRCCRRAAAGATQCAS